MESQQLRALLLQVHTVRVSKFGQCRPASDRLKSESPDSSIQKQSAVSKVD